MAIFSFSASLLDSYRRGPEVVGIASAGHDACAKEQKAAKLVRQNEMAAS